MNQVQILRKLSGQKRLEQAIELSDLTRELAIANIRTQLDRKTSKKEIMAKLYQRLKY